MTLTDIRAAQRDDAYYPSDHALQAFLNEIDPATARLDLLPTTAAEVRHLVNTRRNG